MSLHWPSMNKVSLPGTTCSAFRARQEILAYAIRGGRQIRGSGLQTVSSLLPRRARLGAFGRPFFGEFNEAHGVAALGRSKGYNNG